MFILTIGCTKANKLQQKYSVKFVISKELFIIILEIFGYTDNCRRKSSKLTACAHKMSFRAGAIEKEKWVFYTRIRSRRTTANILRRAFKMTKIKNLYYQSAILFTTLLSAVLVVCANTTSCFMVHQPKTPERLSKYSKLN